MNKIKKIKIGYLDFPDKSQISSIEINKDFLGFLGDSVEIQSFEVRSRAEMPRLFKGLGARGLDYLFVDSYAFLLESFLLREKLGPDIPLIVPLHAIGPWIYKYIYLTPLILENDVFFAPSEYSRKLFLKISDRIKVRVIPNALDTRAIRAGLPPPTAENETRITFLGRLEESKGAGLLIAIMPELVRNLGNVRLNIIGPLSGSGTSDRPVCPYVKSLQRRIKDLGMEERITLTGVQRGSAKYALLARSDLFVLPTVFHGETFSVANLEALACGIPVISTDWGGIKEMIRPGYNGYLLDVKKDSRGLPSVDKTKLINAIIKVLKNGALQRRLRSGALASAARYDHRKVLPKLIRLLTKRVSGRVNEKRWDRIRNKRVTDFAGFFRGDFHFFLHFYQNLRTDTYADLYRRIFSEPSLASRSFSSEGRQASLKNDSGEKIKTIKRLAFDVFDVFR